MILEKKTFASFLFQGFTLLRKKKINGRRRRKRKKRNHTIIEQTE